MQKMSAYNFGVRG